jgi:hypothetical protein
MVTKEIATMPSIMDKASPLPQPVKSTRRLWAIVVGIALFASLMALRYELSSAWARAAVAGCAFVILGCGVFMSRMRQP